MGATANVLPFAAAFAVVFMNNGLARMDGEAQLEKTGKHSQAHVENRNLHDAGSAAQQIIPCYNREKESCRNNTRHGIGRKR
jgi:hypothetical protein